METKISGKETKRVYKTFFVWSEHKEARWLREMSKEGWHLKKASFFNYTFEKGEPNDTVFQFDFRMNSSKDELEYLELFKDAGWEFINRVGGWYYFRKLYQEGEQNEIYTDIESLKQKYRKLLLFLFLVGFPLIFNFFNTLKYLDTSRFYKYFWPFNAFVLALWTYAFIRILVYINKLIKKE